ncbi:hypothetical protein EG329_009068 [Mollisiaceae sp. DMI_Dod_QoI]|nr:hypothetical protein EG329_009068 [Helotiales sp. DMI_Dod_QoI]
MLDRYRTFISWAFGQGKGCQEQVIKEQVIKEQVVKEQVVKEQAIKSPLLTLPREVRDIILSFIAYPALPALEAPFKRYTTGEELTHFCGCTRLKYINNGNKMENIPTLIVNRQLRAETLEILELFPTKHPYIMDLILVNETNLWVTWLSVQLITERVDEIYIPFRNVGMLTKYCRQTHKNSLIRGRYRPSDLSLLALYLNRLFLRFLRNGAMGRQKNMEDKQISIRKIIIDVQAPDVPVDLIAPRISYGKLHHLRMTNGKYYHISLESMAQFVANDIRALLRAFDGTAIFASMWYERIGMIEVRRDGELEELFDLAEMLAKAKLPTYRIPYDHDEETSFNSRVATISAKRAEMGLPVRQKD